MGVTLTTYAGFVTWLCWLSVKILYELVRSIDNTSVIIDVWGGSGGMQKVLQGNVIQKKTFPLWLDKSMISSIWAIFVLVEILYGTVWGGGCGVAVSGMWRCMTLFCIQSSRVRPAEGERRDQHPQNVLYNVMNTVCDCEGNTINPSI